ncbi:penicillin-binding protein activator [Solimonas terrae]|uniref:Penicillin-binding protein activator n=1 Tax=Solimonas terrae TaxID=1396819 RepID=A0A6M2BT10_9GAMM|nr:penicillin-binding protein activator [Solimonas terrae]NGY05243.1 penicillin-binding protein activator [Solimonas terrae]
MVLKPSLPKTLLLLLPVLLYACATPPPRPEPVPTGGPAPMPNPPPAYGNAYPAAPPMMVPRTQGSIALLLPLSGTFSSTAESVRDGFFSAYFADAGHPAVRVYDVGSSAETLRVAYQTALREGANFIVGPLRKEYVAQLAAFAPPVPVLSLNYLDNGAVTPANFLQFGLAPADEARSAAEQASAAGLHRAAALVPDADWGGRALTAFDEGLRANGGAVVSAQRYQQSQFDQTKAIADLMGVGASQDRHRALTTALGEKSEFEPQRRNDLDMVFIGAREQDARALIPQLLFNRAGGLPIYATALVYDGTPTPDINGVRFCDAPWIIGQSEQLQQQRGATAGLTIINPRLFALGRDAYTLSAGLAQGRLRPGEEFDGASGHLLWRSGNVIGRKLSCVQIGSDGLQPLTP